MIRFLLVTLFILPALLLLKPHAVYARTFVADTLQPVRTTAQKPIEKPIVTLQERIPKIKEVPKSRRVIKPMAVPSPLPIKPIKVIKPRIIPGKIF